MIDLAAIPTTRINWPDARRVIGSRFQPIDLFEDIADPEDWPLLVSAEQKTNPRLMETIGNLDLVPPARRVGGAGASYLMAPFTHVSPDRTTRFSDGRYGVLYIADRFETALMESIHHHGLFMSRTNELPGWTSQFRELIIDVDAELHDIRGGDQAWVPVLHPDDYSASQQLGATLRANAAEGIAYPSQRDPDGECVALFHPDLAANPRQARHLDYHWNGTMIDLCREAGNGKVYRIS